MMKRFLLYILVITMPLAVGALVAQSARWTALQQEVRDLNSEQEEWIEANKRLMTDIATLSSPERIEKIARFDLGLQPMRPEDVTQIRIASGKQGQ
jgi:cell division protein FtsL